MTQTPADRMAADLTEGYEDVTRGLARMTKHLGADAGDAVSRAAADFVRSASSLAEEIKRQAEVLANRTGHEIRVHPIASAAIAAAVVGLLGYAITHTRHPKNHRPA